MSNTSTYLSPEEIAAYQSRRNAADTQYGLDAAKLAYARGVNTQNYEFGNRARTQQWDRQFAQLGQPFARRGLANSGIYEWAKQNYGLDRMMSDQASKMQYGQMQGGYDLQQQQADIARAAQLSQIDSEESARRSALASILRSVQ